MDREDIIGILGAAILIGTACLMYYAGYQEAVIDNKVSDIECIIDYLNREAS